MKEKMSAASGFLVLISFVLIGVALYIDYRLTNAFLIKLHFDALSFFQVLLLGYFARLMVGAQNFEEPIIELIKKEKNNEIGINAQCELLFKTAIHKLIANGLAVLVYVKIIVPKFLS